MNKLIGKIIFKKFNDCSVSIKFTPGINIVYGESGVGKSVFLESIKKNSRLESLNFEIIFHSAKLNRYSVSQNPDNQLLSMTVGNEITFAGECLQKEPTELKKILNDGLKYLPKYIYPEMNPGYLSGGEKEQLNLITALEFNPDVLLIDDGLSFLSDINKKKYIGIMNDWVRINSGIIIWVTSEQNDLKYGNQSWILSPDSFELTNNYQKKEYPFISIDNGKFNCFINKLSFGYDNYRNIFSEFSINIENVRSLGLYGENGSGKTTFAGLCFGDLKPTQGLINFNINGNTNLNIGYLDQFPEHLIQLNTINEFYKNLLDNSIFDISMEYLFKKRLSMIGLEWDYINDKRGIDLPWSTLRILLIVLLCHCKYDMLILDEPTFGLGWDQRIKIRSFINGFMKRMHFMIISHDLEFINSVCDQVINFYNLNIEH